MDTSSITSIAIVDHISRTFTVLAFRMKLKWPVALCHVIPCTMHAAMPVVAVTQSESAMPQRCANSRSAFTTSDLPVPPAPVRYITSWRDAPSSLVGELAQLAELREGGALTEQEFGLAKGLLLGL